MLASPDHRAPAIDRAAGSSLASRPLVDVRCRVATGVLSFAGAAWLALAWLAFDMDHPLAQLTMPASAHWSGANVVAMGAMWGVMMVAMMLPSALPMVLTFSEACACQGERSRAASFVAAYVTVWLGFSLAATALQWTLQLSDLVDPMLVSRSAVLNATLLVIAGVYQFSPLKNLCLARCRTPFGFLLGEWRPGPRGGFVMGLRHGLSCLGCCWALMALLFVGGVMNLAWVAALSLAVAAEKLAPQGARVARSLGMALIAAGALRWLTLL